LTKDRFLKDIQLQDPFDGTLTLFILFLLDHEGIIWHHHQGLITLCISDYAKAQETRSWYRWKDRIKCSWIFLLTQVIFDDFASEHQHCRGTPARSHSLKTLGFVGWQKNTQMLAY
jgi:hypothetical protein